MTSQHFLNHVTGPLKEAGVEMPNSKMEKVRRLASRYQGVKFDIPAVAQEISQIFSGSIGYDDGVARAIEKNLKKGPFY